MFRVVRPTKLTRRGRMLVAVTVALMGSAVVFSPSGIEANPPIHVTVSDMMSFDTMEPVAGASILTRDNDSITINVSTTGLGSGAVYTTWWVIFNRPSACATTPCGLADLANASAQPSVVWATGFIADMFGTANFGAHLERSNPPGQVLFGPGLTNVRRAEIHIVVRTHGDPIPGQVDDQMSLFNGGCTPDGAPPDVDGDDCFDPQFSIHVPE